MNLKPGPTETHNIHGCVNCHYRSTTCGDRGGVVRTMSILKTNKTLTDGDDICQVCWDRVSDELKEDMVLGYPPGVDGPRCTVCGSFEVVGTLRKP